MGPGEDPGKQYRSKRGIPIVPSMDGFRSFAILGIVVLHLVGAAGVPESAAFRTVFHGTLPNLLPILFILSGFVVFLPTVARRGDFGSAGAYAIRRAARLLPAYWVVIAVVLMLIVLWPSSPRPPFPDLYDIGIHVGAVHTPARMFDTSVLFGFGLNGPLWTLSLEITFYVLLPLIASAYFRRPFVGLAIAALITIGWREAFNRIDAIVDLLGISASQQDLEPLARAADAQFPGYALHFGLGMTAAWLFVRLSGPEAAALRQRWAGRVQIASLLALAGLAWLFGRAALGGPQDVNLIVARGNTAILVGLAGERNQIPFSLPLARWLGDISYGIYLIHVPLIFWFGNWLGGTELVASIGLFPMLLLTALPLSVLYGYLSARLLEQPIRRWAHRFGRRAQAPATPVPAPPAEADST